MRSPRPDRPFHQIVEVILLLELAECLAPFTRCPRCSGTVTEVAKTDVADRREPLTHAATSTRSGRVRKDRTARKSASVVLRSSHATQTFSRPGVCGVGLFPRCCPVLGAALAICASVRW
ncbi:hypothetical protein [Rhodococcus koreensis]